jgi:hypothetical protein
VSSSRSATPSVILGAGGLRIMWDFFERYRLRR